MKQETIIRNYIKADLEGISLDELEGEAKAVIDGEHTTDEYWHAKSDLKTIVCSKAKNEKKRESLQMEMEALKIEEIEFDTMVEQSILKLRLNIETSSVIRELMQYAWFF